MSTAASRPLFVRYAVPRAPDDWVLDEDVVPESQPHDLAIDLLKAVLLAWVARTGRSAQIARNLAVRWDESRPRIGVDPDLCVVEPRTPDGDDLMSLCTWMTGHAPPPIAFEVVSASRPRKDYVSAPDKYASSGTGELVVFDPALAGPHAAGGPFRVQVWRRSGHEFVRVYAGDGPVRSEYLDAFLVSVGDGRRLRVADDRGGLQLWPTAEETERTAKDAALAAKDAALAAKDAALTRIAELEAALADATRKR